MAKNIIDVDHLTIRFNLANEKTNNLKEYAIKMAKRQLMFQEFLALKDVSLHVRKGEAWGLIGTNGSGKSTLLKAIAGILQPYRGSITVRGNIAPLIELGAGFDMELTARENIFLNGTVLGHSREFMEEHFDEIVDFAGLGKFLDSPIKNFSSGMKTRLGFSVATMVNPQILIVDEVLSVGDYQFRKKCNQRMEEMLSGGTTLLYVSHNIDSVKSLCTHAIWLDHGDTIMIGPAKEVCDAYQTKQEQIVRVVKKETEEKKAIKTGNKYDYLIVGAGLFGAAFAREAYEGGKRCLVIEKKDHIGGAVYTKKQDEIEIHRYGPHIFHTENQEVWSYIQRFSRFLPYVHMPMVRKEGELYNLPFNMNTFHQLWGVKTPLEAMERLAMCTGNQKTKDAGTDTLEEYAVSQVGEELYHLFVKSYMEKLWGRECSELPSSLGERKIPVSFTYSNRLIPDRFQGIPEHGYTSIIEEMLDGIEVRLQTSYSDFKRENKLQFDNIIFTGSVDEYFDYQLGKLEYRYASLKSRQEEMQNFQGNSVIFETDAHNPALAVIEHKHFSGSKSPATVLSDLYVTDGKTPSESQIRYLPVRDGKNLELFEQYREMAKKETNVVFAGRLGNFRYMSMDRTIEEALKLYHTLNGGRRIDHSGEI